MVEAALGGRIELRRRGVELRRGKEERRGAQKQNPVERLILICSEGTGTVL